LKVSSHAADAGAAAGRASRGGGTTGGAPTAKAGAGLAEAFEADRGRLWAVCYRMTGSAADADDLVQETFARALERPPPDASRPWRPWLVRVAVNLARDQLRRRRRRGWVGPWLPEPVETADLPEPVFEASDTAGRYELLESVSYAFLVALEALTPGQRAVLILRDVLAYSTAETAEALEASEAGVRASLLRARRRMASYDERRCRVGPELAEQARALLEGFCLRMAAGDAEGMASLLREDVVTLNDGGGRFAAARLPVRGARKVARFHAKIFRGTAFTRAEVLELNGLPALVAEYPPDPDRPHLPSRFALMLVPDGRGRIDALHSQVVPEKLARLSPFAAAPPATRTGA